MNNLPEKLRSKFLTGLIFVIVFFFAEALLLPQVIPTAKAAASGDFEYAVNEDGITATITGYNGAGGDITIPGTFTDGTTTYTVTVIGESAFAGKTAITSALIPNVVASIETNAFSGCSMLRSAYFTGNSPMADASVFSNCAPGLTVYYQTSSTGFSNPWNGYPAAVYNPSVTYTVNFNMNGATGTAPNAQTVYAGVTAACPADPSYSGKFFGGWYTESACTTLWDFDNAVTGSITLFARWNEYDGSGTEDDPYLISTVEDLAKLATLTNAGDSPYASGKYYKQTADIDLSGYNNWVPIGANYTSKIFSSIYNGNDKNITGMEISSGSNLVAGLFGYIGGVIKNLTINGEINIPDSNALYTGGIAAYTTGGTIQNCISNVRINVVSSSRTLYIGGITGATFASSKILLCSNVGEISGNGYSFTRIGGIAGSIVNGVEIRMCNNIGNINARGESSDTVQVGGVVGLVGLSSTQSTISQCYNVGYIYSERGYSGGIVASNASGNISDCYNANNVYMDTSGMCGGIVGNNSDTVQNCYNIGLIRGMGNVGGIVGTNSSLLSNCYYSDTCSVGIGSGSGTTTRVTLDSLRQQVTYSGFDFDTVWTLDEAEDTDYAYPQLRSNIFYAPASTVSVTTSDAAQGLLQGSGEYSFLDTVTITATANDQYSFVRWEVVSGSVELASSTSITTTFTMPLDDVSIRAIFANSQYDVTMQTDGNGTASGAGTYGWGTTISLAAMANSGYQFIYWEVLAGGVSIMDIQDQTTTFVMPQADVTIKAHFDVNPTGYTYTVSSEKATITDYTGSGTNITVPDRIGGYPVIAIGGSTFNDSTSIISITIPKGIQSIEVGAFSLCNNLASVEVSSENLNFKSINGILYNKSGTVLVYYPAAKIGVFTAPESVSEIAQKAFYSCTLLTSASLPGVTSIGDYAFYGCTNLSGITCSNLLETVGTYAFKNCSALKTISLGTSIQSIGAYAFHNCSALKSITLSANISSINEYTFYGCASMKDVSFGGSVQSIGSYAFYDCSALTDLDFGDKIKSIGTYSFGYCDNLAEVNIEAGSIGDYAFDGCGLLSNVKLGEGVSSIGAYAFAECAVLKSIEIPQSVRSIGNCALAYGNIECVYFWGAPPTFGTGVFINAPATFKVYYHVTNAASWASYSTYPKQAFCQLTADLQDGSSPSTNHALLTNFMISQPTNPTRTGYIFAGWYKEPGCINAWGFDTDVAADDVTLYAKWNVGYYTISATANNTASGTTSGSGSYLNGAAVTLNATPYSGYRFVRWTENSAEVSRNASYTLTLFRDVSLVAEFIPLTRVGISCANTDATLYGGANGSVSITAWGGDSGSYEFSLDGGVNWQNSGYFGGLAARTYTAAVRDAAYPVNVATYSVTVGQPPSMGTVSASKIPSSANAGNAITVAAPAPPRGYTTISVTYSSTNPSVAAVDSRGNVTFLAGGKATIITKVVSQTVDSKGRVKTNTATVKKTVTVKQPVAAISLNMENVTISRTQKVKLTPNIAPVTASNKKITWTSSNSRVASVSSSGLVTGKAAGTVIITCRAKDGSGIVASCTVTVTPIYPSGVKISKTAISVKVGKTYTLKATVIPSNTDFKTVTWQSSNPAIATVDSKGKVRAIAPGTVTITVTTSNGYTASCIVTVN